MPDPSSTTVAESDRRRYNLLLLCVAGLGGLLYGVDAGIIGGALPYLKPPRTLTLPNSPPLSQPSFLAALSRPYSPACLRTGSDASP